MTEATITALFNLLGNCAALVAAGFTLWITYQTELLKKTQKTLEAKVGDVHTLVNGGQVRRDGELAALAAVVAAQAAAPGPAPTVPVPVDAGAPHPMPGGVYPTPGIGEPRTTGYRGVRS